MNVSGVFVQCPKCKEESFEIIRVGAQSDSPLPNANSLDRLYESIRQAAYAQCESCGYEVDGNDLVDLLEQSLLEEGE